MKVDADKIADFLGMHRIGPLEIEDHQGSSDHWGGWDLVNSSKFVDASRKKGGVTRAKNLPDHNRSEKMRRTTSLRNLRSNPGNSYALGMKHTTEARKKISENNGSHGSKWMTLGNVSKKIPSDQIDDRLNDGWKFGRVMR